MARMSIDDMVQRDPRITVLAGLLGWSRRETLGCLVGEVWPVAYDQETPLLSERIIDAAANHSGFARAMVEAELATLDRSGKVRITGAQKRIEYLVAKSNAGRQGGLKSAESRRKDSKQTSSTTGSTPRAPRNPPDPVPDPASVPVPDPVVVGVPKRTATPPTAGSWTRWQGWWNRMREVHAELRASGIEPNRHDLPAGLASPHDRNIAACERNLLDSGVPVDQLDERVEHVLQVRAAEALAAKPPHLGWFVPSKIWDPIEFARALDKTVEQVSKPREAAPSRGRTVFDGVADAREELRRKGTP